MRGEGDIDFTRDGMGAVGVKKATIKQFLTMGDTDSSTVEAEPYERKKAAIR